MELSDIYEKLNICEPYYYLSENQHKHSQKWKNLQDEWINSIKKSDSDKWKKFESDTV